MGKRQFGSRILAGMIVLAVCGCAGVSLRKKEQQSGRIIWKYMAGIQ